MILSIVTGTYNRLHHLRTMITSARINIPAGISYEIIIVDGGSIDGTQAWCKAQADIILIEHKELRGAIAAFCDGAKAARGDYVLLANDDILFDFDSIIPAIMHLETNPTCGAVAFADDRLAPGYEHVRGFKVQEMPARRNGHTVPAIYAQVGLFRRWLGDAAGWWGADDSDFDGHTYGGDNYLSARIWESGYSVEIVDGCRIRDSSPIDELRDHNYAIERQNPGLYHERFPGGPVLTDRPQMDNPQSERLRILYLPIYERGYGKYKRGLRDALARAGLVYEIDYVNQRFDLSRVVRQFQPHVLLMQCHAHNSIDVSALAEARQIYPGMLVVNWNGDVYEQQLVSKDILQFLRHVDLQLTVNFNVLPRYEMEGIHSAYWQVAFEPVDYENLPVVPKHDVVMLANAYSPERQQFGMLLQNMPGINVGLYGRGWKYAQGESTYNFAKGAALYQNAKIAIGDNQYPNDYGFVSNRIFEALASGVFLLHQTISGLEELTGIQDGVHYVAWSDITDLQRKIKHWLQPRYSKRRQQIAAMGREYTHSHHSFDCRVRELFQELIPRLREYDST